MVLEIFEREYELENNRGTLIFRQEGEGDVNCVVWDAALVLAKYLEVLANKEPHRFKGLKIIELGAGLGCVGIVAACMGGDVVLTDRKQALDLLHLNLKQNETLIRSMGGTAYVKDLDWSGDIDTTLFKVILIADCVYYEDSVAPLVDCIDRLSDSNTEILLSQEDRSYSQIQTNVWRSFCDLAKKKFSLTPISLSDQHNQFSSSDIHLLRLRKCTSD